MIRLLWGRKDGGPESHVTAYGVESKRFASLLVLRFGNGTRDAYHSHAFGAVSWLLRGALHEAFAAGATRWHLPRFRPIVTRRTDTHRVYSYGVSWVVSLRGPWAETWYDSGEGILGHGRVPR